MYRAYVPENIAQTLGKNSQFFLDPQESHHLIRVLRALKGQEVICFDGSGLKLHCEVLAADPRKASLIVQEVERLARSSHELILAQGLPKGKTFEDEVRAATALGVSKIIPLITQYSQLNMDIAVQKSQRWQQASIEACKQSGNLFIPEIAPVVPFLDWMTAIENTNSLCVVASLEPVAQRLDSFLPKSWNKSIVLLGPEGDFSKAEYALSYEKGFKPISLSTNVLRSEVAAIYALSILDNAYKASAQGLIKHK